MISASELEKIFLYANDAYDKHNVSGQQLRQNGNTPYITHPLFAASMLLADRRLPQEFRENGYIALLLHDILEDTDKDVPGWVNSTIRHYIEELTFSEGLNIKEKVYEIKQKSSTIKVLLLADLLSNMYEEHVSENKKTIWKELVKYLSQEVKYSYGETRLTVIADAIVEKTDW